MKDTLFALAAALLLTAAFVAMTAICASALTGSTFWF